jgi:hypothetical protein
MENASIRILEEDRVMILDSDIVNIVSVILEIVVVIGDIEDFVIVDVRNVVIRRVPTHQSATLERTVHLEVERTVGEIRPVSSVLLKSSRQ